MKILFRLLVLSILVSCVNKAKKLSFDSIKMEIEIIPEFGDGGYLISWNDTLCSEFKPEWNYLEIRPCELYCFVTNMKNDTLGYYRGLSTPRQFTYFQTKNNLDSLIQIKYVIGINHFSEFLAEQTQDYIDDFNENSREQIEFEPLKLNLKKVIRNKIEVELKRIENNDVNLDTKF